MTDTRPSGVHAPSRGLWIWRGSWTVLLVALVFWGGLGSGLTDLFLIALGTGLMIVAMDVARLWRRHRSESRP